MRPSCPAARDSITNPNAEFLLLEGETHTSLLRPHTAEYTDYAARVNEDYAALYDAWDGAVPEDARAEFYAGIDKSITGGVWQELMERIDAFYQAALQEGGA